MERRGPGRGGTRGRGGGTRGSRGGSRGRGGGGGGGRGGRGRGGRGGGFNRGIKNEGMLSLPKNMMEETESVGTRSHLDQKLIEEQKRSNKKDKFGGGGRYRKEERKAKRHQKKENRRKHNSERSSNSTTTNNSDSRNQQLNKKRKRNQTDEDQEGEQEEEEEEYEEDYQVQQRQQEKQQQQPQKKKQKTTKLQQMAEVQDKKKGNKLMSLPEVEDGVRDYFKSKLGLDTEEGQAKLRQEYEEDGLGELFSFLSSPGDALKHDEDSEMEFSDHQDEDSEQQKISFNDDLEEDDDVEGEENKEQEEIEIHEEQNSDDEDEEDKEEDEGEEDEGSEEEEEEEEESNNGVENKWKGDYYSTNDLFGKKLSTTSSSKYVPPSLRKSTSDQPQDDQQTISIKRQLISLINRISIQNIIPISNQIQSIFSSNPLSLCSSILSTLFITFCLETSYNISNSLVYTSLISVLHKDSLIVGGTVLEHFGKKISESLDPDQQVPKTQVRHLVSILAGMSLFNILDGKLLFDFMTSLFETQPQDDSKTGSKTKSKSKRNNTNEEEQEENKVEIVKVIIEICGTELRSEYPLLVKSLIEQMQSYYSSSSSTTTTTDTSSKSEKKTSNKTDKPKEESERGSLTRQEYILDLIYSWKNNKSKTNTITSLFKSNFTLLKSNLKSKLCSKSDRILLSWHDLIHTTQNRYWLVGTPQSKFLDQSSKGSTSSDSDAAKNNNKTLSKQEIAILELAKKHRMVGDTRKSVFMVLMTCEDEEDALERLMDLNLKQKEEREILYVLVYCCLSENKYNPFYANLGLLLCNRNYNYKFTFQYHFWDQFKEIGKMKLFKVKNFAEILSSLICNFALSLSVLKGMKLVNAGDVVIRDEEDEDEEDEEGEEGEEKGGGKEEKKRVFVRMLMRNIMMKSKEKVMIDVFRRVSGNEELEDFREMMKMVLRGIREKNKEKVKKLVDEAKKGGQVDEKVRKEVEFLEKWSDRAKLCLEIMMEQGENF